MIACACSAFWYGTLQQISNLLNIFFSRPVRCYLLPLCTGCKLSVMRSQLALECTAIQQFSHEKDTAANFQHLWSRMGEMLMRMVTPGDGLETYSNMQNSNQDFYSKKYF